VSIPQPHMLVRVAQAAMPMLACNLFRAACNS
jgi:hypothetical protein